MTDYKKYALGQVENFLYDAMSSGATPQEIYDTIRGVVEDNYYTYKKCTSEAYELLALLNGNGVGHVSVDLDYPKEVKDDCMPPWGHSDMEALKYTEEELNAMCDSATSAKKGKVNKWVLPVEETKDADTDEIEYFITFPDDLLEATDLKEGDQVEWIDNSDGSFKLIKKEKKEHPSWEKGNDLARVKTYQEMVDGGWSMTDDGFWIMEN
jgi:bifunctional DNA-binding transcriptional regulator/antitoxin component of YhaV-PrlF toxin-antitoxin module